MSDELTIELDEAEIGSVPEPVDGSLTARNEGDSMTAQPTDTEALFDPEMGDESHLGDEPDIPMATYRQLQAELAESEQARAAAFATVEALRQRLIQVEMEVVNQMASKIAEQQANGPS